MTITLSGVQFNHAENYILEKSRPLESALYLYDFKDGNKEEVLKELKFFQNEDGGFGNGLEPDFRCKHSSALSTSIALNILLNIGTDHHNQQVKEAINYLLGTYDKNKKGWAIAPDEVTSAPHAIWWSMPDQFAWGNQTAKIIGSLFSYNQLVDRTFLKKLIEEAISYLHAQSKMNQHEFLSFLRLAEKLSKKEAEHIYSKLLQLSTETVTTDIAKWSTYCLQPHQIVRTTQSPFYETYKDILFDNLSYLAETQTKEGYWQPTWHWGQYEDVWPIAEREWRGKLTLDNLITLRMFEWID
ncbi:hypothetical protein LC087_09665 [Bacillus carboniphilus]|uniref:Uncharacterized protein n=1 Tax=Bacillus carboniphilus TaxID=86663 RepID=A0ABY9JP74_9BACI|nr:hypothetical protein [Bacillus carboniphilus]WLR41211.1 hypothetical protein LC087_09665 [Bacillus carboniphilus]